MVEQTYVFCMLYIWLYCWMSTTRWHPVHIGSEQVAITHKYSTGLLELTTNQNTNTAPVCTCCVAQSIQEVYYAT